MDDPLVFADDAPVADPTNGEPWKLLIADDEEDVHRITKMALANFTLDGRPLEFLDAYSGEEAVYLLDRNPDTAMVLMDVVMESDSAGLDAVDVIRNERGNKLLRIVLRTGQPGQAPEREVVLRYDINDYREKTELTAKKLFTLVYTGLHQYHEMYVGQRTRIGLSRIVDASAQMLRQRIPNHLAQSALHLLAGVLGVDRTAHAAELGALMVQDCDGPEPRVLAAIGRFVASAGQIVEAGALPSGLGSLDGSTLWALTRRSFLARIPDGRGAHLAIYLEAPDAIPPTDSHVLDVFCRNVAIALSAANLQKEMDKTQRDLILMLSEAIERRSRETGNHVRRVGEYSRYLGKLLGMADDEADILMIGAVLHDAGKIAVPDSILNKPGRLSIEERTIMETHAQTGASMFEGHDLPVLRAAMVIAAQHHERWDGLGYPQRLQGEAIHPYGRIAALADVFDALGSHRCYKRAWPLEDVLQLIRDERGRHFEPRLVDLFLANLPDFLAIRDRFVDPTPIEHPLAA